MYKKTETSCYVIAAIISLPAMESSMLFWNKNCYKRENNGYDGLEYHKPKRCPLLRKEK